MRTEMVELTNLCMIKDGDKYLCRIELKKIGRDIHFLEDI